MSDLIVAMTSTEVLDAYKSNGVSEKRVNRAQQAFAQVPEKGIFGYLFFDEFKDSDTGAITKFPSIKILDLKGEKEIGKVSVGTLTQQIICKKVAEAPAESVLVCREIKNPKSDYVGQWFLAGKPLSKLQGDSEIEIISNLIGKPYSAKKVECFIPKVEISKAGTPVFAANKAACLLRFDVKDCHEFVVKYED